MNKSIKNKKILIFGGTGSLGNSLVSRFLSNNEIFVFSRDEAKHWAMKNKYKNPNLHFYIGDVRDCNRVFNVIKDCNPHIIIIACAMKQVDACEINPQECINTNILGTNNIIQAIDNLDNKHVECVLYVSTDKSCQSETVYGSSKLIAERIVIERSRVKKNPFDPKYVVSKYGNILESRGSVIVLYKFQSENAKSITVTHKDMTRFLMTLDQSVDLIQNTILSGQSGETWIPKLKSMKILDLAELFSELSGKPIEFTGIRFVEKIHECLVSETESMRTRQTEKNYIINSPFAYEPIDKIFRYSSDTELLTKEDLKSYLISLNIFDLNINNTIAKSVEEIKI